MTEANPENPDEDPPLFYVGRRVIKSKLVHCFVEDAKSDNVTFYPKAKAGWFSGAVIGACYAFASGKIPPLWGPARIGEAPEEDRIGWQARDRAAYLQTQEKGRDSSPELEGHIAALRTARAAVPFNARTSFDVWLLSRIK